MKECQSVDTDIQDPNEGEENGRSVETKKKNELHEDELR
jgi:hypothetical protein